MSADNKAVKLIECPRDAMQGLARFVPTETKASYINSLLQVGFDTVDFGSFVSPKAIPQMKDTADVLSRLDLSGTATRLLAIVANVRGAQEAAAYDEIASLGFPFSISETFQQRNTHSSIGESEKTVHAIYDICGKENKNLVVYLSMAFGNPYGDPWNSDIAAHWVERLHKEGIRVVSLADTVGVAETGDIKPMFASLISAFPDVEFGAHLHCKPGNWFEKTNAAFEGGCRRFDAAIRGFGGCPMAHDELVGNLSTENLIQYLEENDVETGINKNRFMIVLKQSEAVFS